MVRNCGSLLLVSVLAIHMAQGRAQSPTHAPAAPSTATARPTFDVASIHPSPDRTGQPGWAGVRTNGGTLEARGMSLKALVGYAYVNADPERRLASGGADWFESQRWDIKAKVDDPSFDGLSNVETNKRMRPMMQALLEERFHLKLHIEQRPTAVYALVQAKGGAKVKEVPAPPEVKGDWMEAMKHYREENPDKPFPGVMTCDGDTCTATATPIRSAIGQIQIHSRAGIPLIDETGLKGYYDFSFRNLHSNEDHAMAEIEEDLGMKFKPRKVDFTTYVIDSAEKPSEN